MAMTIRAIVRGLEKSVLVIHSAVLLINAEEMHLKVITVLKISGF
jgi:hypothetical protein